MTGTPLIYAQYYKLSVLSLFRYFASLMVPFHEVFSVIGFMVFLVIVNQLLSGTMLAFSLCTESMIIPLVREEEDLENLYVDDFFWLHERGVDLLFIFVFIHLFRKLYLDVYSLEKDYAWKTGAFSFLIIQLVVFLGLVLCCTHLSDITLVIANNAFRTFFLFTGKVNWLIFTDGTLNTDTIIRLAYLHYVMGFFLAFLGLCHGVDMHYDWQPTASVDGIKQELVWFDEVLVNELGKTFEILAINWVVMMFIFADAEPLSYEMFMWGDIGMIVDVRFYGVAPHWYFRPYMAWLIACPYHYLGLFGLIFFFVVIYFQPDIGSIGELGNNTKLKPTGLLSLFLCGANKYSISWEKVRVESNFQWQLSYTIFLAAILYSISYLPYGRFYHSIGGNFMTPIAYMYIFSYLGFSFVRKSWLYSSTKLDIIN